MRMDDQVYGDSYPHRTRRNSIPAQQSASHVHVDDWPINRGSIADSLHSARLELHSASSEQPPMGGISGANMASLTSERDKLREEADMNARRMEARNIRNNKLSAENAKLKSQVKSLSDNADHALAQRDASNNRVRELEAQLASLGDKLKEVVVPRCARELCAAAREGNAGAISVLLNGSTPPNAREECARALGRALCAAVIGKHVQVVQLLLTHKPEFSATLVESGEECQCNRAESGDDDDACGCHIPVVHLAARGGSAELVEMILRASPAQLITSRCTSSVLQISRMMVLGVVQRLGGSYSSAPGLRVAFSTDCDAAISTGRRPVRN